MKQRLAVLAVVLLTLGIGGSLAYAEELVVNVQFQFKAGDTTFPAGRYQIDTNLLAGSLIVRNVDTGHATVVPFVARLAPKDEYQAQVVFDRDEDQYFLSEVCMPGIDGFEIKGAQGKHSHVNVMAARKNQ